MLKLLQPRWVKLVRDVWITKGRIAMMVLAIAAGVFALTTILSAYTILNREVSGNYLSTNPASATLELDQIDDALLASVRSQSGIAAAEARATLRARIATADQAWLPLTLFVVQDFKAMQVSSFQSESGAWPPPEGTLLLEREALKLLRAKSGQPTRIKTLDGMTHALTISGVVHDPSLAPAWQEQTAYGYITPATLKTLGESGNLRSLKIAVKDQTGQRSYDAQLTDSVVSRLAAQLRQQGHVVGAIRIPPPGQHPHQGQMNGVLLLLLLFSCMALLLSGILSATMVNAMLAQQVRQIGVMKAIGAGSRQIAGLYLAVIAVIGVLASALGLSAGIAGGLSLAEVGTQLFNINLRSSAIPAWAYTLILLAGILLPVLLALPPILKATRITVRAAIGDFGAHGKSFGTRRLDTWLARFAGLDRSLVLALRNSFRRRGRLLMTLALLATAGGLFIATLSVKAAWEQNLVEAAQDRHYDLETILNRAEPEQRVLGLIAGISGVQRVESWKEQAVTLARADGLRIERTYPDGGHGSMALLTVPQGSKLSALQMLGGRWLQDGESGTVVLNNAAARYFSNPGIGDSVELMVQDRRLRLRVVGIAREIMSAAQAYITQASHAQLLGNGGLSNTFRIAMERHDADSIKRVTAGIDAALERQNIITRINITETMLGTALDEHTSVLIVILLLMSLLMAGVGALGLASAMSTNVAERTREFGIMRTIGGTAATVLRNVIGEGVFIGLMSWGIALLLSLPLAAALGGVNRGMNAGLPLPLMLSPAAAAIWLALIVLVAMAASAYPARRAAQLTIRETLAYA